MQASEIGMSTGGAMRKTGAEAQLSQKQRRRFAAASASRAPQERAPQERVPHAGKIRSDAALAVGLAAALAASLGALQLPDAGLRAPIIWVAESGIVILAAMLVLLHAEWRKQATTLRALIETRQRLATAVESGSLGVWEWDVEAGRVHCDESWFALLGGERRERSLTTAELAASVHASDLPGLLAAARNMLRGKTQTYDVEHRIHTLRGDCIWVRSRGKVVQRGPDGRAQRVVSVVADIGERVALVEAQRSSRALLLSQQADLLQCFHSAAVHWGNACMVLPQIIELVAKALNAERASLWYYSEGGDNIVCADSYETSSERHCSGMERDVASLPAGMRKPDPGGAIRDEQGPSEATQDEFFVDELVASAPAAMYLPILRSGVRIGVLGIERAGEAASWATEERLYGVMISNLIMLLLERDAHREAQNTLQECEHQLRLITDSVPALIAYVNAEERLDFHNRAYYARFGQTEQSAIGRPLREVLGEPLYRRTRKRVRLALNGTEMSFRSSYRTQDGVRRTDFVRLVPHLSEGGDVLGFYALLIDVTEQRRSEEKLKEALNQAESAARGRDAFLATVSHELRTPLNAIIGFNSLMLEKNCSPEERRRYLGFARDAGQALLTQVNDLLDMAKIDAGKIELEPRDFDLPLLIESSVNMVRNQAQSRDLDIGSKISGKLCRWVRGDQARLRQILLNLLSNALKFTQQGSILVSARPVGDRMVEISVADSGAGIPPDSLEAIFEKFNQADISIARRFGGTGLGLAICRSLARLMGGEISVESTLGSGSVFRLTVPLHPAAAPAAVAAPLRGSRTGHILVVEDQEANAILAKSLLEDMGHEVELASNGIEALDRLLQHRFDVVLMDLEMPVMGGLEAARRIRAMASPTRNMPVIAMSASACATDIARCKAAGMDEHIAKPIGREALTRTLEHWIPERRMNPRDGNASLANAPLSKLVAEVGRPAAMQVAAVFEAALVKRLELFRAERLDLPAIRIEVHNLVGISSALGFDEITEIARKVQDRFGQGSPVEELVPQLIAKCEAAEHVLRKLLGDPVAGQEIV